MRVEVRAEHDHLGREIAARNLRDGVEPVRRRLVVELRLDVELHLDRHAFVEHAHHAVVVLDGERDLRRVAAGDGVPRAAAARKDRAAVGMLLLPGEIAAAGRHVAVGAPIEHRDDAFCGVEVGELLPERGGIVSTSPSAAGRRFGHRRRLGFGGGFVVHPQDDRPLEHPDAARRLREDDLPGELAVVGREVRFARDAHAHDVRRHGALRPRRPLVREGDDRLNLRLDEMRAEAHERPSLAERPPLLVHACEAPLAEPRHRPLARLLDRRRSGEPRTVDVAQPRDVVHHLRARQPLVANAPEHLKVELFALRGDWERARGERCDEDEPLHAFSTL